MNITVTINPAVESAGIQTIGKALGKTGTDADLKGHLSDYLKSTVASLYVKGDKIQRVAAEDQTALDIAAANISTS